MTTRDMFALIARVDGTLHPDAWFSLDTTVGILTFAHDQVSDLADTIIDMNDWDLKNLEIKA